MRKLLLATVAGLSISMGLAGIAEAQTADDGLDDTSGQSFPTPGSVTVRLNGRVRFYADYMPNDREATTTVAATPVTGQTAAGGGTVGGSPTVAGQAQGAGSNKIANYGFQEYARLYPGFDGVAANGLKYGAAIELRFGNVNAANASSGQNLGAAGGGLNGSISGQSVSRSDAYLRRSFGYFGTDMLGTVRVGSTDGPLGLYETGDFQNYADGNWNGDVFTELPTFQQLVWPFYQQGNEYTPVKIVYLSPAFYGVDVGASFEPSTGSSGAGTGSGGTGCGTAATIGCDQLDATPTNEIERRRNTVEVLGRYRGTFDGFGLAVTAATMQSGKVSDDGTPRRPTQYEGLNFFDGGLTVTYAGVTAGGHASYGAQNNNGPETLQKIHGKPELAWIAGTSYTVGPIIVGGSYIDVTSEGSNGNVNTGVDPTGQRREQGVSVGGTYSVAPGFALFAVYDWDQRKEGDYDFVTGAMDQSNNKVTGQVFGLGTSFAW